MREVRASNASAAVTRPMRTIMYVSKCTTQNQPGSSDAKESIMVCRAPCSKMPPACHQIGRCTSFAWNHPSRQANRAWLLSPASWLLISRLPKRLFPFAESVRELLGPSRRCRCIPPNILAAARTGQELDDGRSDSRSVWRRRSQTRLTLKSIAVSNANENSLPHASQRRSSTGTRHPS